MNSIHRRLRTVATTACAAVLLGAASGVPAQTVFRHVNAEGQVTFSDRPEVTPQAAINPAQGAVPAVTPEVTSEVTPEAPKTRIRRSVISPRRAAMVEANEAERRLGQARLKRERGAEPLPGEWVRSEGYVNDRYWRRQEKLRREVEQALRRFNETRRSVYASR